jgi:Zn-dependent protease
MKYSGVRIFRIGGIDIIVDYSCFVFFGLIIYTAAESYFPQSHRHYTNSQCWLMGLALVLLLFASILLHECAHLMVALKQGVRVSSIRLLVFGGLQQVSSEPESGRHDFLMALAGPAASMAAGLLSLILYYSISLSNIDTPMLDITAWLSFVNIGLLSIHNLLPGFPLDGGRILRAFLWDRWNDMSRATKVVSQIGSAFALFLIVFGILQLLVSRIILSGLWFIFVGFFMKQSATGIYNSVMLRRALSGVQVRQVMTEKIVTVDWLTSVEELVRDYIYRHQFTNFPVLNRDEFIGMVSLDGVKTISKDLWGFKQVRDIMTPVEFVPCLKPADDSSEALSRMISGDIGCMPVVENGKLMGIVSRRDIMNLFKIKSDLGVA